MGQAASRGSDEQPPPPASDRRRRRSALIRLPSTSTLVSNARESERSAAASLRRRSSRFVRSAQSSIPNVFNRSRQQNTLNRSSSSLLNNTSESPSRPLSPHVASDSQDPNPHHDLPRGGNVTRIDPGSQSDRRTSIREFGSRIRQSLPQNTLRRRIAPMQRGDDHTAMLSRLLSVAAAHTAASILREDPGSSLRLRNDDDGAFDNFLESLQNGSLQTALGQSFHGGDSHSDAEGRPSDQLNFFRMFRLGTVYNRPASPDTETARQITDPTQDENDIDGRMVPIIIVGIRSINSGNPDDAGFPPLIEALSNLPATTAPTNPAFDGLLSAPRNNTSFSHRRRASMGGLANLQSAYENHRTQPLSERARPFSATSESLTGARPPPSTPASAGLSAYPSGATTPTQTSNISAAPTPSLSSRHGSFVRNAGSRPDSSSPLSQSPDDSETLRRSNARRRRRSDSDFGRYGSGSSRRNGVVGLDSTDDLQEEAQRSWIIYVLGGSYPENHPILSTPSLFSDSPTYEDMLLLASLIGPAKPPVASEDDVARAPGLFRVARMTENDGEEILVANEVDEEGMLVIAATDRCLVCLSEFAEDEVVRQLIKCRHLFHKDCIDQVRRVYVDLFNSTSLLEQFANTFLSGLPPATIPAHSVELKESRSPQRLQHLRSLLRMRCLWHSSRDVDPDPIYSIQLQPDLSDSPLHLFLSQITWLYPATDLYFAALSGHAWRRRLLQMAGFGSKLDLKWFITGVGSLRR